jgi:hypothetical protein
MSDNKEIIMFYVCRVTFGTTFSLFVLYENMKLLEVSKSYYCWKLISNFNLIKAISCHQPENTTTRCMVQCQ